MVSFNNPEGAANVTWEDLDTVLCFDRQRIIETLVEPDFANLQRKRESLRYYERVPEYFRIPVM